jgi:hypothetical protein
MKNGIHVTWAEVLFQVIFVFIALYENTILEGGKLLSTSVVHNMSSRFLESNIFSATTQQQGKHDVPMELIHMIQHTG